MTAKVVLLAEAVVAVAVAETAGVEAGPVPPVKVLSLMILQ